MADAAWLAAHHSRWQASPSLIGDAVRRAGYTAARIDRLIIGQANEAYSVATHQGDDLVVRMAHRRDPKFAAEAAVIEAVRARGIPAPEVLALWFPDDHDSPSAVLVERKLPGSMLSDIWRRSPEPTLQVELLGELIARVHEIRVTRFGNLDADLVGTHDDYSEWFIDTWLSDHLPATLDAVLDDAVATAWVRAAEERIVGGRELLGSAECRLAHGDLSPTNVLVVDDRISGIVDWEATKGAPQTNDFAWWSTFAPRSSVEALVRGYQRVLAIDSGFWEVYALSRLRIMTTLLVYTRGVGDQKSFASALRALGREFQ